MRMIMDFGLLLLMILSIGVLIDAHEDDYWEDISDFYPTEIESDVIDVNHNSEYCNTPSLYGFTCNYQNTNKTVRIPNRLSSLTFKLVILEPTELIIYPSCIAWILVFNAKQMTTLASDTEEGQISTRNVTQCLTWLRVFGSHINIVAHGVWDLSLENCTVNTIHLRNQRDIMILNSTVDHLQWIDWTGYSGDIKYSTIKKLSHLTTIESLQIHNSHLGEIIKMEFFGPLIDFINCTIDSISSFGLNIRTGKLVMENLIIRELNLFSITTFEGTRVEMRNVTIIKAQPYAFSFYYNFQSLILENVTVMGEILQSDSIWIAKNRRRVADHEVKVTTGLSQCVHEDNVLECNFAGMQLTLVLDLLEEKDSSLTLILKNVFSLIVHPMFHQNLTILHSNVSFMPLTRIERTQNDSENVIETILSIRNCSVANINCSFFSNLDFRDSNITSFSAQNVSTLHLNNVNIKEFAITTRKGSNSVIKNSHLKNIQQANFDGHVKVMNSMLKEVQSLSINSPNDTSIISNSTLFSIKYKGIKIQSGHLKMIDVRFFDLVREAIYLEEDATFLLNPTNIPPSGHGFISILSDLQVKIMEPDNIKKDWLLTFRHEDSYTKFNLENSVNISLSNLPISSCSSHILNSQEIECDFKNLTDATVIVHGMNNDIEILSIINAHVLVLYPTCVNEILLSNVLNGSVLEAEPTCLSWLHVGNSTLHAIRGSVEDADILTSHINILSPNTEIRDIRIAWSKVSLINGLKFTGKQSIDSSSIGIIEEMIALGDWSVIDSRLDLVKTQAIVIYKTAEIFNSSIGTINSNGIIVYGTLSIKDTTIENLSKLSICLNGLLRMENVHIKNCSLKFVDFKENGWIQYKNVTINGKLLKIHNKILYADDKKDFIITPNTIDTTTTTTTPFNKPSEVITVQKLKTEAPVVKPNYVENSITKQLQPNKHHSTSFPVREQLNIGNISTTVSEGPTVVLGWLGALMGFCFGVSVSAAVLYVLLVFKPKYRPMTPFNFRWRAGEEQQDLVPNCEEEEMSEGRIDLSPL